MVKQLLEIGKVDFDAKNTEYGRMPLSWAVEKGHKAVIKLLLNIDIVDVNTKNAEFG